MRLSGARVVVTGASRGIGAALATELSARGARLVLVARSAEPLEKLAAELGGEAFAADLTDGAAIEPLVRRIEADGPIDVLVNNAGVDLTGALVALPTVDIERLLSLNLTAPILLSRAVLPGMLRCGRGHILNVSSLAGTNAVPGLAPYSASKAGLSHFTAGLRAELKGTPVTTTLAEIGAVESTMIESVRSHEPTRRAFRRLERMRLSFDLDQGVVVAALADAIEHDRRHVRLPRRSALFPLIVEVPRRVTEFLLAGVR
ncbi:MAG TPA: SDR family NAD(P)-dependent oxidoreductase [Acidimicrobiia bacterium]|nr:SDR family NAD(P)-dependent oxidoreductase [Acidimicrobiia bacterium]